MAPVPIIIGTTLAIVGTGYAFKKFVYDPHLAPLIDAFIEEQKRQHQERQQQRVCMSVNRSEGRSSATARSPSGPVLRRRRPAEMYELDESESRPLNRNRGSPHIEHSPRKPLITLEEKIEKALPPSPSPLHSSSPLVAPPLLPETHVVVDTSPSPSSASLRVGSTPEILSEAESGLSLTSPFVDAETYTPRSGSPISPHALSPAFGSLTLAASDFTFPSPNVSSQPPSRPSSVPLSTSSWADDEHWRSGSELDSEWDALSDAAPSR